MARQSIDPGTARSRKGYNAVICGKNCGVMEEEVDSSTTTFFVSSAPAEAVHAMYANNFSTKIEWIMSRCDVNFEPLNVTMMYAPEPFICYMTKFAHSTPVLIL